MSPNQSRRALSFALFSLVAATSTLAQAQQADEHAAQDEPFAIMPVEAPPPAPNPAPPRSDVATAHDDERLTLAARPEPEREWYGWQTLSADASSIGVMVAGGAAQAPGLFILGLGGFLFATPIIHGVHHGDWALPSLGMRLGGFALIISGAVVALSRGCFDDDEGPTDCSTRGAVGAGLALVGFASMVSSIVLDAVFAQSEPQRPGTPRVALWSNPLTRSAGVSLTVVE